MYLQAHSILFCKDAAFHYYSKSKISKMCLWHILIVFFKDEAFITDVYTHRYGIPCIYQVFMLLLKM